MPTAIEAAHKLIQFRLAEFDAEAKDLERALVNLGGRPRHVDAAAGPKKVTTAPAKAKTRAARKPKTTKTLPGGVRSPSSPSGRTPSG